MSSRQQTRTPANGGDTTTAESNPTNDTPAPHPSSSPTAPLPPDATVLATPRGSQYHKPLGQSLLPKCGARAGGAKRAERMTRYRAEETEDLDGCSSCFGAPGAE